MTEFSGFYNNGLDHAWSLKMQSLENQVDETLGQFLYKEGFRVTSSLEFNSFDNAVVTFRNESCRIRIILDRGFISLALGPLWDPDGWNKGPWYAIEYLVAFLTGEEVSDYQKHEFGKIVQQLRELEHSLRDHLNVICKFFTSGGFEYTREELEAFILEGQDSDLGITQVDSSSTS